MYQLWLTLHLLAAIGAFGFGFAAPVLGAMSAKEPQHAGWFLRASKRVDDLVITPLAFSMAVTGVLLVAELGGLDRFREPWLALSIVLYVAALIAVFVVQRPTLDRIIVMTANPPGPDGPPPELARLVERLRSTGLGLTVAVVAIVVLMVFKPM